MEGSQLASSSREGTLALCPRVLLSFVSGVQQLNKLLWCGMVFDAPRREARSCDKSRVYDVYSSCGGDEWQFDVPLGREARSCSGGVAFDVPRRERGKGVSYTSGVHLS